MMPTTTEELPVVMPQAWSASMSASGVPATPLTAWPEFTRPQSSPNEESLGVASVCTL